jgi:hypothetical protein
MVSDLCAFLKKAFRPLTPTSKVATLREASVCTYSLAMYTLEKKSISEDLAKSIKFINDRRLKNMAVSQEWE